MGAFLPTRRGGLLAMLLLALITSPAGLRAGDDGEDDPTAIPPGRLADPAPFDLERHPIRDIGRADRAGPALWGWQLAAFLAALAAAVAILRGIGPRRDAALTNEAVCLLGALPLGAQHGLRVVRFGRRTLLIGISPGGCHLLAETDETQEGIGPEPAAGSATPSAPGTPSGAAPVPLVPVPLVVDGGTGGLHVAPASRGAA
jgi:hypothetical protein